MGLARRLPFFILAALTLSEPAGSCARDPPVLYATHPGSSDPRRGLFPAVFAALPARVTVLPTENYYYFRLMVGRATYRGSLNFYADGLAKGVIGLNIEEAPPGVRIPPYRELSRRDGVRLRKLDDTRYLLSYGGVAKEIRFNDAPLRGSDVDLPAAHEPVGKTVDESGLGFVLVFDRRRRHLYWVLTGESVAAAELTPLAGPFFQSPPTGFIFYRGPTTSHPVLIGVSRDEVRKNSFCDGPFDQLPDMAVAAGRLDLSAYLIAERPSLAGQLDRYGKFLKDPAQRVAVEAYRLYVDLPAFLDLSSRIAASTDDDDERIRRLTESRPWLGF